MKIKTSIATGLIVILVSAVWVFLVPASKAQRSEISEQTEIPVVIKTLMSGDRIVAVGIQCAPVLVTKLDTLERFSCAMTNNTDKSITASSVRYSVVFDLNGKEKSVDQLDTAVPYIHPDLWDVKKAVEGGGNIYILPRGPIFEAGSVIKRLEIEPVYIEFTDGTTVGVSDQGKELIAKVRAGAALYKDYLRRRYAEKGSAASIIPLLQDEEAFDSETLTLAERSGAKAYRASLLEKYHRDGVQAINEIFRK